MPSSKLTCPARSALVALQARNGWKAEWRLTGKRPLDNHVGMLELSCHCGLVTLTIKRRPDYINECNCTLCSKTGARWGYFQPSAISVHGTTKIYCRSDKDDPVAQIHFCGACGTTMHFTLTADAAAKFGQDLIGVNMRLADERDLAGIEMRYPDGYAWSGSGDFGYVREAHIIGQRTDEDLPC